MGHCIVVNENVNTQIQMKYIEIKNNKNIKTKIKNDKDIKKKLKIIYVNEMA